MIFPNQNLRTIYQTEHRLQVEALEPRMMLSSVEIFAAGATGQENFDLVINDQVVQSYSNVGGDASNRDFESFFFDSADTINADEVAIRFTNDAFDFATGFDRNLFVDRIVIDGVTFQTEAANTRFVEEGSSVGSFLAAESLLANGQLEYNASVPNNSVITVIAAGSTGEEILDIRVAGELVDSFNVGTNTESFSTAIFGRSVSASQVEIAFRNDLYLPEQGIDRNLTVFNYFVNGQQVDPNDSAVFSNAVWRTEDGIVDGFGRGNTLATNGFFRVDGTPEGSEGTRITIAAGGYAGGELLQLTTRDGQFIGEVEVGREIRRINTPGDVTPGVLRQYFVETDLNVDLEELRISFVNDGVSGTNEDRNVTVSYVVVEDLDTGRTQRTSTLDNQTFSTGTYLDGELSPGFGRGSTLFVNGYFEFKESSRLSGLVSGDTGSELFIVRVRGEDRGTFSVNSEFVIDLDDVITDSDVAIEFVNDGLTPAGEDRNIAVQRIVIDGRNHNATPATTSASQPQDPNAQNIRLTSNGIVIFGRDDPGNVGVGDGSPFPVGSVVGYLQDGSFNLLFLREGEADGPITFDWDAETLGGVELVTNSGTVVMRDDQRYLDLELVFTETSGTGDIVVTISNPSEEGLELLRSPRTFPVFESR